MRNILNACFFFVLIFAFDIARLSIDLFDRPKIRDMHINKAKFPFFSRGLVFFIAIHACVRFFYDCHR